MTDVHLVLAWADSESWPIACFSTLDKAEAAAAELNRRLAERRAEGDEIHTDEYTTEHGQCLVLDEMPDVYLSLADAEALEDKRHEAWLLEQRHRDETVDLPRSLYRKP